MTRSAHSHSLATAQFAVGLAGFCAFINLYSPQAVLPLLSQEFGAYSVRSLHGEKCTEGVAARSGDRMQANSWD